MKEKNFNWAVVQSLQPGPERIAELLQKDDDGQATEEVAETALQSL